MGPPRLLVAQARAAGRDGSLAARWLGHLVGAALVGWVVFGLAGVPVWQYLIGYCWLGMSVSYIRSFVEHRAVPDPATRSAVVRSGWFFGVLFLFNNLHHTHHARPGVAWYRLPALTEELGSADVARSGAGFYRGYAEVVRRFAFRPFDTPVNPLLTDVSNRRVDATS
jgi:fatty acid desaturase